MKNNPVNFKNLIKILVQTLFFPCMAFAQYTDHRNHYPELDSLEQVLATHPPKGDDLLIIYRNLAWGYLNINGEKVRYYCRTDRTRSPRNR